jgi:hypothetical protein
MAKKLTESGSLYIVTMDDGGERLVRAIDALQLGPWSKKDHAALLRAVGANPEVEEEVTTNGNS